MTTMNRAQRRVMKQALVRVSRAASSVCEISLDDMRQSEALDAKWTDGHGQICLLPAAEWLKVAPTVRRAFAERHHVFLFPTTELVDWLRSRVAGRAAIEIGSGNGAIGRELGITSTDAMVHADRRYGINVVCRDTLEAVQTYRPQVVIAAWVTFRFGSAQDAEHGFVVGSAYGPDFGGIMQSLPVGGELILVGNDRIHGRMVSHATRHDRTQVNGIVSRSIRPDLDCVYVWHKR